MSKNNTDSEDFVALTVRMPKPLADDLKNIADSQRRSFNQQAVLFLEQAMAEARRKQAA